MPELPPNLWAVPSNSRPCRTRVSHSDRSIGFICTSMPTAWNIGMASWKMSRKVVRDWSISNMIDTRRPWLSSR